MRFLKAIACSFFASVLALSTDLSSVLHAWLILLVAKKSFQILLLQLFILLLLTTPSAQLSAVAPTVTQTISLPKVVPTRLGNVDPPPTSTMLAIFTGVPQDVFVNLMKPAGRSSIASEFATRQTPDWYANLPTPVKSYIECIHSCCYQDRRDRVYRNGENAGHVELYVGPHVLIPNALLGRVVCADSFSSSISYHNA